LISEKAEKIFFIDARRTNVNIALISNRVNSVVSFRLIKVHLPVKQPNDPKSNLNRDTERIIEKDIVSVKSSRKDLWALGKKMFNEYSVVRKTFGDGFTFLENFQKETGRYFYPHHLFISVLLFSGIIGLTIYIAILLWSSIIYLFHLKELGVLFFLFLMNFTFGFFSFTDFFGASFYALLFIFPFLYHYLHQYERKNQPGIQSKIEK